MNWEDIIKRQKMMRFSSNKGWDEISGVLSEVDNLMSQLKHFRPSEQQKNIEVTAIEERHISKIFGNVVKLREELKKYLKKPTTKPRPLPPKVSMTPPPKDSHQLSLGHPWGEE